MIGGQGPAVVMLTTSYPRFPGDGIGSFVEPIAHGVAQRGYDVHVVAPWHPRVRRPAHEGRVHFHFFRYAPSARLSLFGYAAALKADVGLRPAVYLVTPLALVAGFRAVRRVVHDTNATILHAHWVIPGGFLAAATRPRIPLVVSLHGSDVFVAEDHRLAGVAAGLAFRRADWVTACSDDLRRRALALGADARHAEVIPYGVDTDRFQPNQEARAQLRQRHGLRADDPVVVAAGRLVRKKGFEYLIDAMALLTKTQTRPTLMIAGEGDLRDELARRISDHGLGDRVLMVGAQTLDTIADLLAAADVVVVPSIRDDAGNVDGLPNVLLEALAVGTPVVATAAGGMGAAAIDGQTARVVPQRSADGLATAIEDLLRHPESARELGRNARQTMCERFSWSRVAERFEAIYRQATARRETR